MNCESAEAKRFYALAKDRTKLDSLPLHDDWAAYNAQIENAQAAHASAAELEAAGALCQ